MDGPSRRLRPGRIGPAAVAGLLYPALLSLYLIPYHGDLAVLVCVQQRWVGQGPFEAVGLSVSPEGFDGAFYYAIAQNPLEIPTSYIDDPSVRHARLLYPLLAWLLSGGDPHRLLWVMPLLNLAAVVGLTWLGSTIAAHHGRSPWWGLVLSLGINAYMPAWRNLTDPLAAMTAVGLIASWLLHRPTLVLVGWGIASVLSREQNIAIAAIVGLDALVHRDWRRAVGCILAGVVWAGWLLILRRHYGEWPLGGYNMERPLAGLLHAWTHLQRAGGRILPLPAAQISLLTVQLLAAPIVVCRGRLTARLVTMAGAILCLLGGTAIFSDSWSYTRVLNWLPLGIWLYGIQSGKHWPLLLLAPAAFWPVLEILFSLRAHGLLHA